MPLPYFEKLDVDSSLRHTLSDEEQFAMLKGVCLNCKDSILHKVSMMESLMDKIKLSPEDKYTIALEGPGRRHYIIRGSKPHFDAQIKHKNYWIDLPGPHNEHIQEMSHHLSEFLERSNNILESKIKALEYAKVCQSIFREVNINSLRKTRNRKFIIRPTGITGVFVMIYPGPKLRVGENISSIWFKVIALQDYIRADSTLARSWIFKRLRFDGGVFYSRWLSTDANRLDHYIRCYDKILMAYASYCSLTSSGLTHEFNYPQGNTMGIISMIYLEDKRSTSKMLQDVRYLVMSALSMFTYYGDILKKFQEPLRTPLQSYLLNKILEFIESSDIDRLLRSTNFGQINVEVGTGDTFDRLTGADFSIPRILTTGSNINFKQMLCEMYFTMLFNKNQDDPTHSSFQILTKILEGEESLKFVKETTNLHTGYRNNDMDDSETLIDKPHKNQFSRRAIMIASKLQASSKYNKANGGVAHMIASKNHFINKSLDEFATYKSSSILSNVTYNKDLSIIEKDEEVLELDDQLLNETGEGRKKTKIKVSERRKPQNPRRRCIEGVMELMNLGYVKSFDLIKNHLTEPLDFQIFKKNQIGGVREILILDIKKRVLINILESFSKLICKDDEREMLTHGDKKFSLMRDMIRDLRRGSEKKLIMNYNFDKTRWAPSFMPIQFLYMFVPFKKLYPSLFRFICLSLMVHTNKRFILPERLIRVWNNDPQNKIHHILDENLQQLKNEFLRTKELVYQNESNMGQGILHYTSSYFHLCFISLRDEVYKRLCTRYNVISGEWRDIVSSDDSYTAHAMPMDNKKLVKLRIILFLKAQEICERVMNVWTSTSKSSISLLVYEFNSLFGSNLTMYPTVLKFALASVHPVNTDSFFRMVKESYIACRQIVENGGSLELYLIASKLNKIYCESIYHTHSGGSNNPNSLNPNLINVPYQLGIYPVTDPALMIMFGPECHNYQLLCDKDKLNPQEMKIFKIMHTLVKINDPEIYAACNSIDDVFVGVNRIEAHMGPVRRLEIIKRQIDMTWEDIQSYIIDHPLILFNPPKDLYELRVKVFMKLYQNNASEALRTTAASLHYARVSATVSAKAFIIPLVSKDVETYSNCLLKLMEIEPEEINPEILYPHLNDYKKIIELSQIEFTYNPRNVMETQNIRQLQLNKLQQKITNPIVSVLNVYWADSINPDELNNSYIRDWINLKESVPIIEDTIEQTINHFPGERSHKIKSLLLIILRLMGYSAAPMKCIIYGQSSRSFDDSYLILKQQNYYSDKTSVESKGLYLTDHVTKNTDKLCFAFNYFILSLIYPSESKEPVDVNYMIDDDEVQSFFLDNSLSIASSKKILIMLMYHGRLENIAKWSDKTKVIFHSWDIRGRKIQDRYIGDFVLRLQLSHTVMVVKYIEKFNWRSNEPKILISVNKVDDMQIMNELLNRAVELSGFTEQSFLDMMDPGQYYKSEKCLIVIPTKKGVNISFQSLPNIKYNPSRIIYSNDEYALLDNADNIIIRTIEGLLHTNYIPKQEDIKKDVYIMGISLKKMIPFRPFNIHFSVEQLGVHDLCHLLKDKGTIQDLRVEKPRVSAINAERLTDIPIDLIIKRQSSEFNDVMIEETDLKIDDDVDVISDMINNFGQDDIDKLLEFNKMTETHEALIDPDIDINIFKTMSRQRITYHPKKILDRICNIKYHIISKLITDVNMVNKKIIKTAMKLGYSKYIVYSLIYIYDTQFTNKETPSPSGVVLKIDPTFDDIFKITDNDDEDY